MEEEENFTKSVKEFPLQLNRKSREEGSRAGPNCIIRLNKEEKRDGGGVRNEIIFNEPCASSDSLSISNGRRRMREQRRRRRFGLISESSRHKIPAHKS